MSMNDFTTNLLTSALSHLKARGQKPEARHLFKQLTESEMIGYRDGCIEVWAEDTEDHVPRAKLIALHPIVLDLTDEYSEWWGIESPTDGDELVSFTAFGLACLRWLNREASGRVPQIEATEDEVAAWLERQTHPQMRMF